MHSVQKFALSGAWLARNSQDVPQGGAQSNQKLLEHHLFTCKQLHLAGK